MDIATGKPPSDKSIEESGNFLQECEPLLSEFILIC